MAVLSLKCLDHSPLHYLANYSVVLKCYFSLFFVVVYFVLFSRQSHYVAKASLKLSNFLFLPHYCWGYGYTELPLCPHFYRTIFCVLVYVREHPWTAWSRMCMRAWRSENNWWGSVFSHPWVREIELKSSGLVTRAISPDPVIYPLIYCLLCMYIVCVHMYVCGCAYMYVWMCEGLRLFSHTPLWRTVSKLIQLGNSI